jgi:hypothetical protein
LHWCHVTLSCYFGAACIGIRNFLAYFTLEPMVVIKDNFQNLVLLLKNEDHDIITTNSSVLMQVDVPSCFVGLVMENCNLPYPNYGHVILADPSPILLYPISSSEVRCLVDIPGKKVPSLATGDMAKYLQTVVAPQVIQKTINSVLAGSSVTSLFVFPS